MKTAVIKGWEDYIFYEDGRCFSKKVNRFMGGGNPKNLNGYITYNIKNKQGKTPQTNFSHRLMMMAFYNLSIEEIKKWDVNHKNKIRNDNHIDNLELINSSKHAVLTHTGRDNSNNKKRVIGKKIPKDFWETTTEEWKQVPGTNNFWCNKKGDFINKKENRYVPGTDIKGKYLDMRLNEDGGLKVRGRKHILMYKIFIGKIPEGYEIHHKDFNSHNNCINNLECLTSQEHQLKHAQQRKNKIPNKLIEKLHNNGKTPKEIAQLVNLKKITILNRLKEILPQKQYTIEITKDIRYFLDDIILDYINGMTTNKIEKKYKTNLKTIKKHITKEEYELFKQISKNNRKLKKTTKNLTK